MNGHRSSTPPEDESAAEEAQETPQEEKAENETGDTESAPPNKEGGI